MNKGGKVPGDRAEGVREKTVQAETDQSCSMDEVRLVGRTKHQIENETQKKSRHSGRYLYA